MRNVFAIFFLLIFLNAHTVFGEVVKLPILIHHFIEHSQENEAVSLFNFLAIHYQGSVDHHHQNNHNDHKKLPFKITDSHFSTVISMNPPAFITISLNAIISTDLKTTGFKQQNYANISYNRIWQPPRIC